MHLFPLYPKLDQFNDYYEYSYKKISLLPFLVKVFDTLSHSQSMIEARLAPFELY